GRMGWPAVPSHLLTLCSEGDEFRGSGVPGNSLCGEGVGCVLAWALESGDELVKQVVIDLKGIDVARWGVVTGVRREKAVGLFVARGAEGNAVEGDCVNPEVTVAEVMDFEGAI